MTDASRPWWADREVVESWVEQKHFDATLAYLNGLAEVIEHRIAYGVDDSASAAEFALTTLDLMWQPPRIIQGWGGEVVHALPGRIFVLPDHELLSFQDADPAHVMVCACSHGYLQHTETGCTTCWHCGNFKYSHDLDRETVHGG